MPRRNLRLPLGFVLLFFGLPAAYSNHFENSFHFDDFHSITDNPSVRSLANLPRLLTDARTCTVLPANQSFRPVTMASLAFDYWLAGGYKPFYFHLSTFVWFMVLIALLYLLFRRAMDAARAGPSNVWAALFAAALFGLHPVCAETVNYIVQRADLYNTVGAAAGLLLWAWRPRWRKTGLYLIPAVLGAFSKAPGLVFPVLLVAWVFLIEGRKLTAAVRAALPAAAVFAGVAVVSRLATPPSFNPGASSPYLYWATQPFVILHYFKSFFLPTGLTADTDRGLVSGVLSDESVIGIAFLCALLYAAWRASRRERMRPIAFGIAWFLIALLPTSLLPLSEVDNDHRMFFAFPGLTLAVVWGLRLLVSARPAWRRAAIPAALLVLAGCGIGTYARNAVWHDEESLWRDVTLKSPHNGRGLMNYGLALMRRGDYAGALRNFEQAQIYTPNYSLLEVNLGVLLGQLNRDAEAERHFERAITLAPADASSYSYYARWLRSRGRVEESIARYETALAKNPLDADSRRELEEERRQANTPERYLELSLTHFRAGRYKDCIAAAEQALRLRPGYAEAYNNLAAAYNALGRWDEGIRAAEEAVRLRPDWQLARNNLNYARKTRDSILIHHFQKR
jgi:Flp pilus assembly protein TadD